MISEGIVGVQNLTDGDQAKLRVGRQGEQLTSQLHAPFWETTNRGNVFSAYAIVTAPVIYTTAAGTGGPLIWNGASNVNVNILKIGYGISVVTTVAAALGWTGNTGQTVAPTTTTAIDASGNLRIGGAASLATAYRIGTPISAGGNFTPFADVQTGALTTTPGVMHWIDVDGLFVIPPNCWGSIAASATATTLVLRACVIWEEVPI